MWKVKGFTYLYIKKTRLIDKLEKMVGIFKHFILSINKYQWCEALKVDFKQILSCKNSKTLFLDENYSPIDYYTYCVIWISSVVIVSLFYKLQFKL